MDVVISAEHELDIS